MVAKILRAYQIKKNIEKKINITVNELLKSEISKNKTAYLPEG
jgi:hypothetical protein